MNKNMNKNVVGAIVFVALMGIFTFLDLPTAKWIYAPESSFGRFFEIIGTVPLPLVGIFSTVSLIMTAERRFSVKTIISYVLGVLLFSLYAMYGIKCVAHQVAAAEIPMTIATVIWTICCIVLAYKIMKAGNGKKLRKAAIVGVIGCFVASILIGRVKEFVARQRFYTFTNPEEEFTYWFQIQPKNALNDSFPSGHAGQAATSFFLVLITEFVDIKDKNRFRKVAFGIAGAFTICVMISRMVLGMHFATDVIFGAALPLISMKITHMILNKNK